MNPVLLFQIIVVFSALIVIAIIALLTGFIVRKSGGDGKKWCKRTGISLLAMLGASVLWIYFVNPLPSDEAMIEHFNEHRAEYEELAKGNIQAQKDGDEAVKLWLASPRTLALKKSIRAKDERNVGDESGQWFSGVRANVFHDPDKGSIEFSIEDGFKFSWREMNSILKIYIFFPEVKFEAEGRLQCPAGSGRKCLDKLGIPLLPSLDGYPKFHADKGRNCGAMARKIDDHWFILLSRAC